MKQKQRWIYNTFVPKRPCELRAARPLPAAEPYEGDLAAGVTAAPAVQPAPFPDFPRSYAVAVTAASRLLLRRRTDGRGPRTRRRG